MEKRYPEYDKLDLSNVAASVQEHWDANNTFEQSIELRKDAEPYVFFEGPPSANGMPGIHHVMARTIKDLFCRYQTQKGKLVKRKAGWDTHGLPIELAVEKKLGITKEHIGKTISIEEYNKACRETVMTYKKEWDEVTRQSGYWVDLSDPYITYDNKYIESVWWLLSQLYNKELLYKGKTIQPYSPKAGTGLSSHELNMPGAYRDVKDTSAIAQFMAVRNEQSEWLYQELATATNGAAGEVSDDIHFVAWTTTPWTLPSNTALAAGGKIDYVLVRSFNQYTGLPINIVMAKALVGKYFPADNSELKHEDYKLGDKKIPFSILAEFKGKQLENIDYEQLMPYLQPAGGEKPFRVILGDFVSTEDGTGLVHIAPTFGADDKRVANNYGIEGIMVEDADGNLGPLVDLQGRFTKEVSDFAGEYVKTEYYKEEQLAAEAQKQGRDKYLSVDERIGIKLKTENKAFKVEKYVHSYPHCWRTDKPILYYPLDSWFVKTTSAKARMIELNNTINWKPASTGTGRFGNWLENLQDWNLSRSRFWGIPLPIWVTEDRQEMLCVGSVAELKAECDKAVAAGLMDANPFGDFNPDDMSEANYNSFDLHRPYADNIVLVSPSGQPMQREADLIDVWFDSGSMPYAQWHYPFENKELIDQKGAYPADFIAEGVDQTRGWFFTLHAIATMCFDSVAYKAVVSNGLVQDRFGQKMSKSKGNAVDSFATLAEYGPDATRWYMISNANPWDNLKFNADGITEIRNKFFRALYNSYAFFALYANVDGFAHSEATIPLSERPEIDRWIISKLNSLVKEVDAAYSDYEPTKAARAIQSFVVENLSNWYVRLCRRRFWKGEYGPDKIAAYQTLYRCIETVSMLSAPIAPFFMDRLFSDLNLVSGNHGVNSVHLSDFPVAVETEIDTDLEERMALAQKASSLVLSLRKREQINVRQPLQKVMIPALSADMERRLNDVKALILSEVNVKELEVLTDTKGILVKEIKANFKTLGRKLGKLMKPVANAISEFSQDDIANIEANGTFTLEAEGQTVELTLEDVLISSRDIPGWLVQSEGGITVALDITISEQLAHEGLAREMINRIQNLRKDKGLEITDRIDVRIQQHAELDAALNNNLRYICSETLASNIAIVEGLESDESQLVEVDGNIATRIVINKI